MTSKPHMRATRTQTHPQTLQDQRMSRHILRVLQYIPMQIMEPPSPRSQNLRGDQRRRATRDVNHATPCKVNHSTAPQGIDITRAQESIVTPNGMYYHRINKGRQENRICDVSSHLTSFSQGTGNDGTRCGAERVLEKPKGVILDTYHKEISISNKGRCRAVWGRSVSESVPQRIESK